MATFSLVASAWRSTTTVSASSRASSTSAVDDAEGRHAGAHVELAGEVDDRHLGAVARPGAPSARGRARRG